MAAPFVRMRRGYSTFIDLFIASQARCLTMGVGKFSFLAAEISDTLLEDGCVQSHESHSKDVMERWGYWWKMKDILQCPL